MRRALAICVLQLLSVTVNAQRAPRDEYLALASSQGIERLWPSIVLVIAKDSAPRLRQHIEQKISEAASAEITHANRTQALSRVPLVLASAENELQEILSAAGGHKFLEHMVRVVYPRYISPHEARALATFFSSPLGEKMLRLTPVLIAERRANPGTDPVAKYFSPEETANLEAFARRPEARKMNSVAGQVKEEMNRYFLTQTESLVDQLAAKYAAQAIGTPPGAR